MSDSEKQAGFLPFHAINEFMRDDFRLEVVQETLLAMEQLQNNERQRLDKLINRSVSVPGFRSSRKAPAQVKIKPAAEAFQKNAALVAATLSAWSSIHIDLRTQVADMLVGRGWEILPPEADRTRLPGFLPTWEDGEGFEVLTAEFHRLHPDSSASNDEISLMAVWVACRLPYQLVPHSDLQPIPGLKTASNEPASPAEYI